MFLLRQTLSHYTFLLQSKKQRAKKTKNVNTDKVYTFIMRNRAHLKSVCKWIINLETSIHMNLHRAAFNTYEVIAPCNVHLGNNSLVKAIEMEFIILKVIVKGKIN